MAARLSPEERQALDERGNAPIEVVDERTSEVYYLISLDQYKKIKALVEADELDVRETYAAQETALANAGWDDPRMDVYNEYPVQPIDP